MNPYTFEHALDQLAQAAAHDGHAATMQPSSAQIIQTLLVEMHDAHAETQHERDELRRREQVHLERIAELQTKMAALSDELTDVRLPTRRLEIKQDLTAYLLDQLRKDKT